MGLAKVTTVETFGKIRRYTLRSGVAACVLPNVLKIVTLARPKYELPDDGRRPKHVGAF